MDFSKLRFLRRAVAFLSFTMALLALINFVFRTRPDSENLVLIKGVYHDMDNMPSGEIVLDLENNAGPVYIKSSLASYFDSSAFVKEVLRGTTILMAVEKEGLRANQAYSGNVLSVKTESREYLPLEHAVHAYKDAVHSARRGFIQFFILTLVLLIPEMTRKRRLPEGDSGTVARAYTL